MRKVHVHERPSDKKSFPPLDIVNFCLGASTSCVSHASRAAEAKNDKVRVSQEPNFTAGGATFLFIRQISLRHGAGRRSRTCKRQKLRAPYFGAGREKRLDQRSFSGVRAIKMMPLGATLPPEMLDFICLRRL